MFNPAATYRIQFHKEFPFDEFEKRITYLQQLGVSTIYASPVFKSVPGSVHGYDGVQPDEINPEIGTLAQLRSLSEKVQSAGMGWLQDIVPNHMAFHADNKWLMDVLEKGNASHYASFFDIERDDTAETTKLMVPVLSKFLDETIRDKELSVIYKDGGFQALCNNMSLPLNYSSYSVIIKAGSATKVDDYRKASELLKYETADLFKQDAAGLKSDIVEDYINHCLLQVNSDHKQLAAIMNKQYYELCPWQETDSRINYRRFFTINGLICLNMQDAAVFEPYHTLIKKMVNEGVFQGLRIDHIDGLRDPAAYLERLRCMAGDETYITVEKILEQGEELPNKWPVQGTTGYDMLALINNLFTNKKNEQRFTSFYNKLTKDATPVDDQAHQKKAYILYHHMNGELENLYRLFIKLRLGDSKAIADIDTDIFKKAIGSFLVYCPVYRYYGNQMPLSEKETAAIQQVLETVKRRHQELLPALRLIEQALLNPTNPAEAIKFYQRCMQFTGVLMAKGVEDTLMYTYNRFIGHNEVGDSPRAFGLGTDEFHKIMARRLETWPYAMSATATHDTKRGEDARARLNVLTDMGEEWPKKVESWMKRNARLKQGNAPSPNDEYFIYQALVGSYPMPGEDDNDFEERFYAYVQKALREGKMQTNWAEPNEEYERQVAAFVSVLLSPDNAFLGELKDFIKQIADEGIINSLSQLLVKFTAPGIPDVYQGCELWDLSMVDPDNRRPVDYDLRSQWLQGLQHNNEALISTLWDERYNGKIKLWLTYKLFLERREGKDTFIYADYLPLEVIGEYRKNILAFARRYKDTWYVTIIRLPGHKLGKVQIAERTGIDWQDTAIVLPAEAPQEWRDVLAGNLVSGGQIRVADVFKDIPIALLRSKSNDNPRCAGVLLPIFSLPSPYGIGDFGREAYAFARFLHISVQKVWQILPLNPIQSKTAYSPYSSVSAMACNTLLISPDMLVTEGLLNEEKVKTLYWPPTAQVNYNAAERIRAIALADAYTTYKQGGFEILQKEFDAFLKQQAYWLDDFAQYMVLKEKFNDLPWHEWPNEYKKRDENVLAILDKEQEEKIVKIKWLQFIAARQWLQLKDHCTSLGVQILGDLPFYVNHDSADVWAHPEIFCLDDDGKMVGVAGVPPDYFSETGQLWGMPTFNWTILKAQNYIWWIQRLRRNLELFDRVRLDHFRAFSSYWQVPAQYQTAVNGQWLPGPGTDFFRVVKEQLGGLPFVAEDLGDYMDDVYKLRDTLQLPGMKVLQFAWGENMPVSVDIPHNYSNHCVAYTGTHDNNTTIGWYKEETRKNDHKRMSAYLGVKTGKKNIHIVLIRTIYASVAQTVIIPVQDLLGLDERARMNTPGTNEGNWMWRVDANDLSPKLAKQLKTWMTLYNRS